MLVSGLGWAIFPAQAADPSFDPSVSSPAWRGPHHPTVLIDEAHLNFHKATGRLLPFAQLIWNDGFQVRQQKYVMTPESLQRTDILVISNALGWGGVGQMVLNAFGLEGWVRLPAAPFKDDELDLIANWVRDGGNLLLVSDHAPCGRAAAPLAARFGVAMSDAYTEDPQHCDRRTGNPGFLEFSRTNGLLPAHPITDGRHGGERVARVITFMGQSLSVPPGATALLVLADTARDYPSRNSPENAARRVTGRAQAVALEYGKGRVVIFGEAAVLTAQAAGRGSDPFRFGMDWAGSDDRKLVLNTMRWLSRIL